MSTTHEIEPGQRIDLSCEVVGLDRADRRARLVEQKKGRPPQRIDGFTVGAPMLTGNAPHAGEVIAAADEPTTPSRPAASTSGGGTGIRTLGGSRLNGFQDRPVRPLRHPSTAEVTRLFPHERRPRLAAIAHTALRGATESKPV
jgi:hypothetical protein